MLVLLLVPLDGVGVLNTIVSGVIPIKNFGSIWKEGHEGMSEAKGSVGMDGMAGMEGNLGRWNGPTEPLDEGWDVVGLTF